MDDLSDLQFAQKEKFVNQFSDLAKQTIDLLSMLDVIKITDGNVFWA